MGKAAAGQKVQGCQQSAASPTQGNLRKHQQHAVTPAPETSAQAFSARKRNHVSQESKSDFFPDLSQLTSSTAEKMGRSCSKLNLLCAFFRGGRLRRATSSGSSRLAFRSGSSASLRMSLTSSHRASPGEEGQEGEQNN